MPFKITITNDAEEQLKSLPARDQRILEAAIMSRLSFAPTTPTKAVKRLRTNPFAEFELRAGNLRVLYNVEEVERSFMAIKTISLSSLETDLTKTLTDCAESGETLVVELPDQRLLAIQALDPGGDDSLIDELLATNPKFQALVAKSKAAPRKPFPTSKP